MITIINNSSEYIKRREFVNNLNQRCKTSHTMQRAGGKMNIK